MTDILDLSSLAPEVTSFTISIDREAEFDSTVDFYEVDADGNVVDENGNAIAPGEEGYAEAAIGNRLGLDLATDNRETSEFNVEFTGSALYAPIIAVNSDFAAFSDNDVSNNPTVYFTYEAANIDGFDHVVNTEEGQFGFEDSPGGGDEDFNDIILNFEEVEELVVEEPVVEEPVVEEPVVEEPVVEEPVVEEPVVEEPVVEEPVVEEPVVEEPVVEEPVVEEPVVEEPVVEEPVVEEPVVEEPVVEEPVVEEPVVEEPVVEEPVVEEPVVEEPVVEEPVVEEPVNESSISGLKFEDLNNNGVRDSELVQGENPDVVFAIDVSASTDRIFQGISINEDGSPNSIFEAETAGFIGLNQQLIDRGFGDNVDIGIVAFGSNGVQVDLDPSTDGLQLSTTPNSDNDGNGIPDIEDVLSNDRKFFTNLGTGGATFYESALQAVEDTFIDLGTEPGDGNLVFLSDGENNGDLSNYEDEVMRLENLEVNLSAFGAGDISDRFLENLQVIDSDAQIFTSTDEILFILADLNSDANANLESPLEPTLTGVTIYLDTNNNGSFDEGEPSQVTDDSGEYIFEDLAAGTYTVREVVPNGSTQTTAEEFTITLGDSEAVENIDFGNISDEALAMLEVESEM